MIPLKRKPKQSPPLRPYEEAPVKNDLHQVATFVIWRLGEGITKILTHRGIQKGRERVSHVKQKNIPEGEGVICTM